MITGISDAMVLAMAESAEGLGVFGRSKSTG